MLAFFNLRKPSSIAPLACSLSAAGVLAFCSQGGGLFIASGSEAHLSECVVSGNEAYHVRARLSETFHRPAGVLAFTAGLLALCFQGGGLYIASGGEAHLSECVITGNEAYRVSSAFHCLPKPSMSFFHRPVGVQLSPAEALG